MFGYSGLSLLSDFPGGLLDFDVQHVSTGSGGDIDVLRHRIMVVPAQSRARGHGFRAWASVLGAACRVAFVAALGRGFAAHVFGIGRLLQLRYVKCLPSPANHVW